MYFESNRYSYKKKNENNKEEEKTILSGVRYTGKDIVVVVSFARTVNRKSTKTEPVGILTDRRHTSGFFILIFFFFFQKNRWESRRMFQTKKITGRTIRIGFLLRNEQNRNLSRIYE